jgi:hypothetical protein
MDPMPTTLPRYSPSGFFRPTTFVFFFAAIAGALLGSWLYQLSMHWIPRLSIYLSIIVCIGFAFGLGALGGWSVKAGHCRNRLIALILALPLTGALVGGSFYWDYQRFVGEVVDEEKAENPSITAADVRNLVPMSKFIELRVEHGWTMSSHGSSGGKMNGWIVWTVWGIEAAIFLGAVLIMVGGAASAPYCERCNQWTSERQMILPGLSKSDADPLLDANNLDALIDLPVPPEPDHSMMLTLTAGLCPTCKDTGFLTVAEKRVIAQKKGKAQQKSTTLISDALMRADQRARFLARLEPGMAPPTAASAAGG